MFFQIAVTGDFVLTLLKVFTDRNEQVDFFRCEMYSRANQIKGGMSSDPIAWNAVES